MKTYNLNGQGPVYMDGNVTTPISGHPPVDEVDLLSMIAQAMRKRAALDEAIANMRRQVGLPAPAAELQMEAGPLPTARDGLVALIHSGRGFDIARVHDDGEWSIEVGLDVETLKDPATVAYALLPDIKGQAGE